MKKRYVCAAPALVRSKLAGIVAGCVLGLAGLSTTALATPPSGFTSVVVGLGTFEEIDVVNTGEAKIKVKTRGSVDIHTLRNTFVPGGTIGWHKHPGPSFVTVVSGTATFYSGDDPTCTPHTYTVGDGVIDQGDDIHNVRNEGDVDLVLVVASIVPEGGVRRIDVPAPGNCPF